MCRRNFICSCNASIPTIDAPSAGVRCSLFGLIARGTHRSTSASCTTMATSSGCTRNGERSCARMIRRTSCGSLASPWKSARRKFCRMRRDSRPVRGTSGQAGDQCGMTVLPAEGRSRITPECRRRSPGKRTLVLFFIAEAVAGCGFLGPQEQVRQEPGRTTYRVPEDNSLERPDITPIQEKVPGESR